MLACIAIILFFGVSLSVSIVVLIGMSNANKYCKNYNYNIDDSDNIELLLYNSGCRSQVYNIFSDYPCNCRFLRIDDNLDILNDNSTFCDKVELYNIDTQYLLTNIFKKWNMLERIWFEIDDKDNVCAFNDDDLYLYVDDKYSVLNAQYLQVLKITDIKLVFNKYVKNVNIATQIFNNWKNIVFLETSDIEFMNITKNNAWNGIVNNTHTLKYFAFVTPITTGYLNQFPLSICKLSNTLQYLKISGTLFSNMDDCIENFDKLEYLSFSLGRLSYVPSGM